MVVLTACCCCVFDCDGIHNHQWLVKSYAESNLHLCTSTAKFILDVVSKALGFTPVLPVSVILSDDSQLIVLAFWISCVTRPLKVPTNACIVRGFSSNLLSADLWGFFAFKGSTSTRLFCLGMRDFALVLNKIVLHIFAWGCLLHLETSQVCNT